MHQQRQFPRRPEIDYWRTWVKESLKENGYTLEDLAAKLCLSCSGLDHRLALRADWRPHDLRDLAEMVGVSMDAVMSRYPDVRHRKWESFDACR